jgi:hypothetical protein
LVTHYNLQNHEKILTLDEIDFLQGRVKSKTRLAYFMENPNKLKKKYIDALNAITINLDVNKFDMKTPEFIKVETERDNYNEEVKRLDEIEKSQIN